MVRSHFVRCVLLALALSSAAANAHAESVALEWDPSEGATGYILRWGTALGSYPNSADAGNNLTYVITGLVAGQTYWAVVQAYNGSEISEYSVPLQFTIPGGQAPCSYSITPQSTSAPSAATSGTVTINTQAGCAWNATTGSGFLSVSPAAGTGPGMVTFSVSANTSTASRVATATIAGKTFTLTQAAAPEQECSYSITPTAKTVPASASTATIVVTTQDGCSWSATSNSTFLTFEDGTGRSGSGSLYYSVAENTGAFRTGTATVAGTSFTVYQAAASCDYTITPEKVNVTAEGTTGVITVTTLSSCTWSAKSMSSFITISNGTDRTGPGTVEYTVAPNTGTTTRSGIAAVAANTFSVIQEGVAEPEPPAPSEPMPPLNSDFDGDGQNDLLVRDSVAGTVHVWSLDGATLKGTQPLSHSMDANWNLVGRGDFNSDGKPDLVWQHWTEGWVYIWYMDGVTRTEVVTPSIARLDDGKWRGAGIGDFNGDSKPDIIWQHTANGSLGIWQMDGATVTQVLNVTPNGTPDLNWKLAGVGDFNSDGNTDLLWRNLGTGDVAAWLMNGLSRIIHAPLSPMRVPDQNWQVGAITDANGDGKPDIIWGHTDGTVMFWHMNGTRRSTYPTLDALVPLWWHIAGPR